MLRKRTRSIHKDQHNKDKKMTMADADYDYSSQSHAMAKNNVKSNSIFNTPLLFVGLGPKGVLDSDSVRSPTSPLDTLLSNLGNPFRAPKSPPLHEGQQRIWDCSKVGLGIIDSLEDCPKFSGKIILSSENKKPNLTTKMINNAPNIKAYSDSVEASKSLPKYFCKLPYSQNATNFHKGESTVLFEIGETLDHDHESTGKSRSFSLDSLAGSNTDSGSKNFALDQVSLPPHFIGGGQNSKHMFPVGLTSNPVSVCSSDEFTKVLSASEIELSEDYTCVISHGPNPKKTHIFRDFILETHSDDSKNHDKNDEKEKGVSSLVFNKSFQTPKKYCSGDFLNFCYHCNKKLEDGKDIYIYRGEKSFCSLSCRDTEIMYDEELEESNSSSENSSKLEFGGNLFEPGIPTAA